MVATHIFCIFTPNLGEDSLLTSIFFKGVETTHGWNTIVSFWVPAYFQGRGLLLLVSGRVQPGNFTTWRATKMMGFGWFWYLIGSLGMVYLPTFKRRFKPHVGKYITYMDLMGMAILGYPFVKFRKKCNDGSLSKRPMLGGFQQIRYQHT